METLKEIGGWLFAGLLDGLGDAVGELLGLVIVGVLFLICTIPIYFLLKKLGWRGASGKPTTFKEDLLEAFTARPQLAESPQVKQLDQIRQGIEKFYSYFLWLVLILATVFIAWFFYGVRSDSSRAFIYFYFGIGYLFLVAWVLGTQWTMRRREQRQAESFGLPSNFSFSSMTQTITLDQQAIETAEIGLDVGEPIQSICARINPEYLRWAPPIRRMYQHAVRTSLEHHRKQGVSLPGRDVALGEATAVETGQPPAAPAYQPPSVPQLQPAAAAPAEEARPWLTSSQIVTLIVVFIAGVALFTTAMVYFQIRGH